MDKIIFHGRGVSKGWVSAKALVFNQPISFWGGVDPYTGRITERKHKLYNKKVTGRIMFFPTSKGSAGSSYQLLKMIENGSAPAGIVNLRADPVLVTGAIISSIPMVVIEGGEPLTEVRTGDLVILDANLGIVTVIRNKRNGISPKDGE